MKILMIDDNTDLSTLYRQVFEREMIIMDSVQTLKGVKEYDIDRYDLVLLDLNLPDGSGYDILKHIRSTNQIIPVIMISARRDSDSVVHGLELGADDFLRKPVDINELVARVRMIMKRTSVSQEDVFELGDLKLDFRRQQVYIKEELIDLTPKHYLILESLAKARPGFVTSSDMFFNLYDEYNDDSGSAMRVHVFNVKKKLAKYTDEVMIKSAKLKGYKLCLKDE